MSGGAVLSVRAHTQARDHLLAPAPAPPLVEWRELRREPPRSQPVLTYISPLSVSTYLSMMFMNANKDIYRVDQKNRDLEQNGHNYLEIHQKGKKLVCFGKFSLNAA